jgi:signal recognition particle subunit SEC65
MWVYARAFHEEAIMPEGSKDATLLIATSWQALQRARFGNPKTAICDCTVVTLFASFFIEANLNYIVENLHLKSEMNKFLENRYPGLQDKLAWFYNKFIAKVKAKTKKELFRKGIKAKLRRRYHGFAALYRFRNDLSHGVINDTARSRPEVIELRMQAKGLVDDLFSVVSRAGYNISRDVTYQEAIQ